ncbi:MAG: accessory factor UbiK family protein [Deltaproteobacteria bacterium]|nr:accessory factor UbiK family protein [Deltaproteobacteria bacterium]
MADILDKAILIGMGLEKKVKKIADKLVEEAVKTEEGDESKLPPRKELENKVVEEGVKILREVVAAAKSGKDMIDEHIKNAVQEMLEKFKVATREDIDVIEKMAQNAREKVDRLEKRIEELETKLQ